VFAVVSLGRKKRCWRVETIVYVQLREQASSIIEFEGGYKTLRKF
jgi:hypothetical protein